MHELEEMNRKLTEIRAEIRDLSIELAPLEAERRKLMEELKPLRDRLEHLKFTQISIEKTIILLDDRQVKVGEPKKKGKGSKSNHDSYSTKLSKARKALRDLGMDDSLIEEKLKELKG